MATLDLRCRAMAAAAHQVAVALQGHQRLTRVIYPGLTDHAQHTLAMRQMGTGGTIVTFDVGSKEAAFTMMNRLQIAKISNNLGDAKTIVTHPATTTHSRLPDDQKASLGITPGLIRLSVGLEDPDDLVDDLMAALQ
jgi:O-succinylhomoserine sulfhydrylase